MHKATRPCRKQGGVRQRNPRTVLSRTPESRAGTSTLAPVKTGVRGCRRFGRGPPSGPKAIRAQPPAILWFLSDRSERNSPPRAKPEKVPRLPGRDPTNLKNLTAGAGTGDLALRAILWFLSHRRESHPSGASRGSGGGTPRRPSGRNLTPPRPFCTKVRTSLFVQNRF